MKYIFLVLCLLLPLSGVAQTGVLVPLSFDDLSDQKLFDRDIWQRRTDILEGIENNLRYLRSAHASSAYDRFERDGIKLDLVRASLLRFRELLTENRNSEAFRSQLLNEFMLYRSIGNDGRGTVRFTGYFQPTYRASRKRSAEFRYPIYSLPPDFETWPLPHPTRVFLEGYDGMGNPSSPLWGHELAWLKSRYEAFMIHVQGSAILEMTDGTKVAVGFAGGTDYPFRGVPKSFLKEKRISWSGLAKYFSKNASDLNWILSYNNRFIMFKQNPTPLPIGSLGSPVIAERSIATDKLRLPPGALGLIRTQIPHLTERGVKLEYASRFVLDQDTGSAIKGPGRVDIFMGTGAEAQSKANSIFSDGELYYLVLKEGTADIPALPRS